MTDLAYRDIRPILAKVADLGRDLVLVGGQAVNFWAHIYERRVPTVARDAPFTSKDIYVCGDQRSVRICAERLNGRARVAMFDQATPNSGTVGFAGAEGVSRTLDIVSAPFGLDGAEVHDTALAVEIIEDAASPTGVRFYVMLHSVLSMESRVHNVVGLPGAYDTEQGRKQLRVSIVCAREYVLDVLDGRIDAEEPRRDISKVNERIFRFCMPDHPAKELNRTSRVDPAAAITDDARLPAAFRGRQLPQMREQLAFRPYACTQVPEHLGARARVRVRALESYAAVGKTPTALGSASERLAVARSILPYFDALDIKVGKDSQLEATGVLTGEAFETRASECAWSSTRRSRGS